MPTYEELRTQLNARGADQSCPICRHHRWLELGGNSDPEPIVLATVQAKGSVKAGRGYGVVGWSCGNCGFVRLHTMDILGA